MKNWNIKPEDYSLRKALSDRLNISPVIAQLLINRNILDAGEAEAFLRAEISELYNPFLMEGMHEAVSRIKRAIEKKERVFIHGDYDVDGVTATALLVLTLRSFGLEPMYYIPDRISDGYGLGDSAVEIAISKKASLVITVDCGVSSYEEVKRLGEHNIDVIITDHHEAPKVLPPAYAIINPVQPRCAYPDKNLSGVSVAFKLCEALCSLFDSKEVWRHVDLVCLGTISDVVPLIGENRILVKEGLRLLSSNNTNLGVKALMELTGLKNKRPGSYEVGFILGPRINATGRMGSASESVRLFLTDNPDEAITLARRLDEANRERQRIENNTLKEALSAIEKEIDFNEQKVIVLHKENWHSGVIGIVASRLTDRFYRPTILISTKNGMGRGSGRSIESFHLFKALTECEGLLKGYGGHRYACGFTILEENLTRFKKIINDVANSMLTQNDLMPRLDIDMELPLDLLDDKLVQGIKELEPFGEQNPEPVFCSRGVRLASPVRILKGGHIRLVVTDGYRNFEAIGFGMAGDKDIEELLNNFKRFDLAYTASFNSWQGLDTIQLRIEDIRFPFNNKT